MFKQITLWLLSSLSFSVYAQDVANMTQQAFIQANKSQWQIVDVRTPQEYAQGHIPGAINLPLSKIVNGVVPELLDKDQTTVLYCRSGYRAGKASKIMQGQGFSDLKHLEGDMLGWQKSKLAIQQ
jgi:rhodanese-related sulfurtransferase